MPAIYLVQYGKSAFLGRFEAAAGCGFARNDRVVIDGPRGAELGLVLCETEPRFSTAASDGRILRPASDADEAASLTRETQARQLLRHAQEGAASHGLPLTLVDAEIALESPTVVLHGLAWADCDANGFFEELSTHSSMTIRFLDLSRTPVLAEAPEKSGCGKAGCGSGGGGCSSCGSGGGCSTGSCSRGKVKNADELGTYFAGLRRQMEAESARRMPLA